jgi:hypothetical protein
MGEGVLEREFMGTELIIKVEINLSKTKLHAYLQNVSRIQLKCDGTR